MIEVLEGLLKSQRLRAYEADAVAAAIAALKGQTGDSQPIPEAGIGGSPRFECEGCGGARASGQPLCRLCMFTLPGGVAYDLRRGVAGAFESALRILHS